MINVKKAALMYSAIVLVAIFGLIYSLVTGISGNLDNLETLSVSMLYTDAYKITSENLEEVEISEIGNIEFNQLILYVKESYATNPDGFMSSQKFAGLNGNLISDKKISDLKLDFYVTTNEEDYDKIKEDIESGISPDFSSFTKVRTLSVSLTKDKDSTDKYNIDTEIDFDFSKGEMYVLRIYTTQNAEITKLDLSFIKE